MTVLLTGIIILGLIVFGIIIPIRLWRKADYKNVQLSAATLICICIAVMVVGTYIC